MRRALIGIVIWSTSALAEPPAEVVRGETIIIHDKPPPPPPVLPRPRKDPRIAPPYSDAAIERDVWTKAWLLLDVDERGTVSRVKFLKRPGYDLDAIAVKQALKTRFTPAEDGAGHPVRTLVLWPIEWPSYWWMVTMTGLVTRIPASAAGVPCAGSGPLHMDSAHPAYRDCSAPDLSRAALEPWVGAR